MKQTKELFAKQMSRREFLQFILMAAVALFGLNNFISFLREQQKTSHGTKTSNDPATHGFGSSKFGA